MASKYRIDPDFVVPEPTGANMYGFCALDKFDDAEMKRQVDWMRAAGAQQMRVTVVSDEYPNEPYPHGYYFEGWTDKHARQLPFGEAEPGKGISPPLTATPLAFAPKDDAP